MRRGLAALSVLLAGCDEALDLERLPEVPQCATPVGHDEDGDRVDDACDLCPGVFDDRAPDQDRDGIGDACDPRPDMTGDQLVRFLAFAQPSDAEHWPPQPTWTVAEDSFVYDGSVQSTYHQMIDPPPRFPYEIQVAITIDAVDRAQYEHIVIHGNTNQVGDALLCTLFHTTNNDDLWRANADNTTRFALPSGSYNAGTRFVARATFTPTQVTCGIDATTGSGSSASGTASASTIDAPAGGVAFNIVETAARIEWIAFYTLP